MSQRRGFLVPIGGAEDKLRHPVILQRFVRLCGGHGARLAVIAAASRLKETGDGYERLFAELGAGRVRVVPLARREDCDREEALGTLREADGVFLTGGNQLRLSATLAGTPAAAVLRERHAQGLHVAGTSAGAAFLSEHMIAGGDEGQTPHPDMVSLAKGLGLTDRLIVDQHFRQRDRLGRLLTAVAYVPGAIGLGLDEDTAAFLGPDDELEVAGSGGATLVDATGVEYSSIDVAGRHEPVSMIGVKLHVLVAGGRFHLTTREARPSAPASPGAKA